MQIQEINKIKGLVNISNKAGYLIIGADNLKKYNKNITFRAENITMDEFIDISNNLN